MAENFTALLENALQLTRTANLPPELEAIAFEKAIDYLLRSTPGSNKEPESQPKLPGNDPSVEASTSPLTLIAQRLQIDLRTIEEIFFLDEERRPQLIVGATKLGSEKKKAMRAIAVPVAGGRQVGGLEEWTPLATVREVCSQYGKLDAKNFSTVMNGLDDIFGYRGKRGSGREMRINRSGWEELKTVIIDLRSKTESDQ